MPEVKIARVVSVSSEDPIYEAANLLKSKKWRCQNVGEQQVSLVLQLSAPSQIHGIDIGNNGSAFVEVQVSRQASFNDYKVILVASSFLTPLESRNENSLTRVRMFAHDKLNADVAKDKWDLIKVICTQPFNKNIKYGLSFITIHSMPEVKKEVKLGAFRLKTDDDDKLDESNAVRIFKSPKKESVATTLRSQETLASIAVITLAIVAIPTFLYYKRKVLRRKSYWNTTKC